MAFSIEIANVNHGHKWYPFAFVQYKICKLIFIVSQLSAIEGQHHNE